MPLRDRDRRKAIRSWCVFLEENAHLPGVQLEIEAAVRLGLIRVVRHESDPRRILVIPATTRRRSEDPTPPPLGTSTV